MKKKLQNFNIKKKKEGLQNINRDFFGFNQTLTNFLGISHSFMKLRI